LREGDININSNGKKVSQNYHNRVVLQTGEEPLDIARLALVNDEIAMESRSSREVKSGIYMKKNCNLNMLSRGDVQIQTETTGVKLTASGFQPIKRKEINWPNLQVRW